MTSNRNLQTHIGKKNTIKNTAEQTFGLQMDIRFMVCLFSILLVSSLWIFTWYRIDYEYELEMQNATREVTNATKAFEAYARAGIKEADYHMDLIKSVYEKEGKKSKSIQKVLDYAQSVPSLSLAGIADENGDLIASSPPLQNVINLSDAEYFLFHREKDTKQVFVGKPNTRKEFPKRTIPINYRLNKPNMAFGGVVIIAFNTDNLTNFFTETELGVDKLAGTDGIVRARQNRDSNENGQDIRQSPLLTYGQLNSQGTFSNISVVDGIQRLQYYQTLPEYSRIASVEMSTRDILKCLEERKWIYIANASIINLVIVALCIVLLKRNSQQRLLQKKIVTANIELEIMNRKLEMANTNLKKIASMDHLTGAWNRLSFERLADREMELAQRDEHPFSLLMLDIDCFKQINDNYGHLTGDSVLIDLVRVIQKNFRNISLARMGGDELVMLASQMSFDEAMEVGEELRQLVHNYDFNEAGKVTLSVGVAEYKYGESIESLIKRADEALYAAKAGGRDTVRGFEH